MNDFDDRLRAVYARIEHDIEVTGWSAMGIFASKPGEVPFTYTIGLAPTFPEMLIVGLEVRNAHAVLTALVDEVNTKGALPLDEDIAGVLGNDYKLRARIWDGSHMTFARRRAEERSYPMMAVQILWPDADGTFDRDKQTLSGVAG